MVGVTRGGTCHPTCRDEEVTAEAEQDLKDDGVESCVSRGGDKDPVWLWLPWGTEGLRMGELRLERAGHQESWLYL